MDHQAIEQAYERIRLDIVETPLLYSDELGHGHRVFFKCENFQITRSYKPRGALNALMKRPKVPTIARSSGNFAQALSWAGSKLKVPITIVMPRDIAQVKIEGTKRWGAKIELCEPSYEAQNEGVKKHPEMQIISPYDDPDIIEGQGTVALEALTQAPEVTHFFGPIGGGGLMGGCSTYIKGVAPHVEVIGVEPEGASDYYQSRQTGKKVTLQETNTIAEGLRTPTVGEHNWPLLNQNVDEVTTVSDTAIVKAMKWLFNTLGIVVEPSGATACAALFDWKPKGDCLVVISGGNVDPDEFWKLYQAEK